MYVDTILKKKGDTVVAVEPTDSISSAALILKEKRIGAALVKHGSGEILGIISERDIVRGLARHQDGCLSMRVDELMTSPVITCTSNDSIDQVMQLMTDRRIRHLPVVDGDTLSGVISIGDVVKQRISEIENESEVLKQYIATG